MQPAGTNAGRPEHAEQLDRPRFRQDLVAELIDEQGARFIDVMDPDSGNLFRFYEVEYSLACAMDGERDVPGIVKWAQEELGLTPSQQEVRSVIATLGDLGFIDTGAQQAAAADLAPGVVVGSQARAPAASQVDLGTAGGAPQRVPSVTPAPDFALGAPGAAARRGHEPVEDVPLGAPGRRPGRPTPSGSQPPADEGASDVSLDLADHIAVGRAEVQEAVRASRVMAAVDVPQSVLDAIEDRPTARASSPVDRPPEMLRAPEPRAEMRPELRPELRDARDARDLRDVRDPRDVRPEARPAEVRVGKPPLTRTPSGPLKPVVELPKPPVPAERSAPVPAPQRARVSPILLVLLVLAMLSGAAYLISRYLSEPSGSAGPSAETATPTTRPVAPPPAPPPPPPPPPPVTAKLALETPPADDVTSTRAGVIETIMADKSTVKAGDVIVKFVGDKPIEAELANISRDVKRLQDAIDATTARRDAAQAAGNKAAEAKEAAQLETQQKNLAVKHDLQATRTTDLDKFLIHAPSAGTFAPAVKLGKKVAAADVLASIQRDPIPIAMFKVTDVKPYAVNTSVELGVGSGEQRVVCTVAEIQEGGLKVACPADPQLIEGAEVTLRTTRSKPEAAQPTDTPAPPGTPGGAAPPAPGGEAPAAVPAAGGSAAAGGGATPAAPMPTTAPAAPAPPSRP